MMLLKWFLVGLEVCLVHGQLSVTWNGSVVQGPVLIFWEELPLDDPRRVTIGDVNRAGALVCRSENSSRVSWQFTVGTTVHDAPRSDPQLFIQTRTGQGVIPSISRLSRGRESTISIRKHLSSTLNGEWRCTLPGIAEVNVGIVSRAQVRVFRKGRITLASVTLAPPSANLNSFTLHGRTLGGPVTNYSWTYNGAPIRNGGPFHITTGFDNTDGNFSYQYHRYLSVLTVTGDLPGVYRYTARNRVTPGITPRYVVQREANPANLRVQQDGPNSVQVFWSVPSPPPVFGYRVTVGHVMSEFESSPGIITIPPGTYRVEVIALDYPLSSEPSRTVFTVRDTGMFPPLVTTSSVRATSVIVTWVQPVDSTDVNSYMIVLTRILGSGQALCPDVNDTRSFQTEGNLVAMHFSGLDEFSTYEVSITANFSEFGGALSPPGFAIFTTDTAVPAGAPGGVTASTASRSVHVSWDAIECSERNGIIIDYVAEFEKLSGAAVHGDVMNQTFIASGLTPHTEYTFRVAGANRDGQGPFSETITFTTDEDVPGAVSNLMADERDTFLVVMWSPPQETNGVIIAYEVAYWTSFSHTAVNTSTLSIMFLSTDIINISVRAYTSAGPGPESSIITRSGLLPLSQTRAEQFGIISIVIAITVVVVLIAGVIVVLMLVFLSRQLSKLKDRKCFTNSLYNDDLPMEDYGAEDVGFLVGDENYTGAADIVEFPSDMCAKEGERVFFRVVMRGDPYPSISWYYNDIELMSDESLDIQQSGSLCILSATQEHSGVYRLLAWNSGGTVEREVKLTVTQQADMNDQKSAEVLPVPADKDSPDNSVN